MTVSNTRGFADRRPVKSLTNITRRADILDHMAEFHTVQPPAQAYAPEVQTAHRAAHSNGEIRMPHAHDLPNTDEVG